MTQPPNQRWTPPGEEVPLGDVPALPPRDEDYRSSPLTRYRSPDQTQAIGWTISVVVGVITASVLAVALLFLIATDRLTTDEACYFLTPLGLLLGLGAGYRGGRRSKPTG